MAYSSEAAKVRDMPHVMQYITGRTADMGAGHDKIKPEAKGYDGRNLPGIDEVQNQLFIWVANSYDTVFSSHFLEHVPNPYEYIKNWHNGLVVGGHLVLYLPDGRYYNNQDNPEHMIDMKYDDFMFWFRRSFCGEGKDFKGNHFPKLFELVDSGMDVGEDRYSFYVIARKV